MAMLKLCRCGKAIQLSDKQCEACSKQTPIKDKRQKEQKKLSDKEYDMYKRDKHSTAFYHSKEWEQVRLVVLGRDHYRCVQCFREKRMASADVVDHIVPLKVDYSLRITLSNLQSLCHGCHNRKTREEAEKYYKK